MSLGKRKFFLSLIAASSLLCAGAANAAETVGGAAPQPEEREAVENEDVEINEGGVSIGSVRNNGGEQKNIKRSTTLSNVTIINSDGKTTIYRKGQQGKGEEKKP